MIMIHAFKENTSRTRWKMKLVILVAVLLLWGPTMAENILGMFTSTGRSHFLFNHAILMSLRSAGHQITMITPVPGKSSFENFTYIDSSSSDTFIFIGQSNIHDFADRTLNDKMPFVIDVKMQYCEDVMKLPQIKEILDSPEKSYDVMLVEMLWDFECYLPIAQKLGIPVIGTISLSIWKTADHTIGVPNNPALIAAESAGRRFGSIELSFTERIVNVWDYLVLDFFYWKLGRRIAELYQKHFTEDILYRKCVSLIFYNSHPGLLPRIMTPNAVEVGGIHLAPAEPLPADVQTFIDEAEHGVILFTFGSVLKMSSLPQQQKRAFLEAFAAIPQRVIWKYEEPLEDLPENIMISEWLPQRDILEHKNVIVFMSHCGQSGMYEAIITGTPVVAIPLCNDQYRNAAVLQNRGVSVNLDYETIIKETVLTALDLIVNDTSYYRRMQELRRIFEDRPVSVQESVVYWTEYVIRHNGAPHLKAIDSEVPFYEYFMLDIVALTLVAVGLAALIMKITKSVIF